VYGSSWRKKHEEYKNIVRDKVEKAEWKYLDVNEHWQQTRSTMLKTAQARCGLSKVLSRHKETRRWNEKVAETVRENKITYGN